MHDVVLLHRCYPSTPHGVGPWLPAPSSAQPDELAGFCDVCGFTWPPDEPCPFH